MIKIMPPKSVGEEKLLHKNSFIPPPPLKKYMDKLSLYLGGGRLIYQEYICNINKKNYPPAYPEKG